jgi:SPASM domain peptide maturase of grasp-with-spasm system
MKYLLDKRIHIFSNCILIDGINRGIIYDLQRHTFEYVPKMLINFLREVNGNKLENTLKKYILNDNKVLFDEYLNFLINNEFVFFNYLPKKNFPLISKIFNRPYKITNLIIDISNKNIEIIEKIVNTIDFIGVESLQLRFFKNNFTLYFNEVMDKLFNSSVRSIEIIVDNNDLFSCEIDEITLKYNKIVKVIIFNSTKNEIIHLKKTKALLLLTKEKITYNSKNIIDISNFSVNIDLYVESVNYNNYFHRKLYIDSEVKIKNSPELENDFGTLSDNNTEGLLEIINSDSFQKYWKIKKDDILVCKNCEYKYMCVDSRVPIKLAENYYFNEECNYNPYISKWKDENGYKNLKDSGVDISENGEVVIDKKKLKKSFEEAWAD